MINNIKIHAIVAVEERDYFTKKQGLKFEAYFTSELRNKWQSGPFLQDQRFYFVCNRVPV